MKFLLVLIAVLVVGGGGVSVYGAYNQEIHTISKEHYPTVNAILTHEYLTILNHGDFYYVDLYSDEFVQLNNNIVFTSTAYLDDGSSSVFGGKSYHKLPENFNGTLDLEFRISDFKINDQQFNLDETIVFNHRLNFTEQSSHIFNVYDPYEELKSTEDHYNELQKQHETLKELIKRYQHLIATYTQGLTP